MSHWLSTLLTYFLKYAWLHMLAQFLDIVVPIDDKLIIRFLNYFVIFFFKFCLRQGTQVGCRKRARGQKDRGYHLIDFYVVQWVFLRFGASNRVKKSIYMLNFKKISRSITIIHSLRKNNSVLDSFGSIFKKPTRLGFLISVKNTHQLSTVFFILSQSIGVQ